MAFLTVQDSYGNSTGYDVSSGKIVDNIPRSFVTLSGEQGILILNPDRTYYLGLTPVGSGPYHLLIAKTYNVNSDKTVKRLDGTITAWEPKRFSVDLDSLTLNQEDNSWSLLLITGLGLCLILVFVLVWHKKRVPKGDFPIPGG